jgi:predicted secreted protein
MTENITADKNKPGDIITDMLKIQIKNCEICRTPRLELIYQDLPLEQQNRFQYDANNYYLFCQKCNTYAAIHLSQ